MKVLEIKAVIFDMDGLLIDSEPLWEEAMIKAYMSKGYKVTTQMLQVVKGNRVDEAVANVSRQVNCNDADNIELEKIVLDNVIKLIREQGKALTGAIECINYCRSYGYKVALASSAMYSVINAVSECMNIQDSFDVVYSAEEEIYGKPHPGVFITTAFKLRVKPEQCVVLEDSVNGVIAAKAANMAAIAVPHPDQINHKGFGIANSVVNNLIEAVDILKSLAYIC